MYMSDRSSILWCLFGAVAFFVACADNQPSTEDEVKDFLNQALVTLYIKNDLGAYLKEVDFDGELDSVQLAAVESMHRQYDDFLKQTRGGVTSVEVAEAEFENDSVCFVHYLLTFADSSSLTSVQKVVSIGGRWKIRSRN